MNELLPVPVQVILDEMLRQRPELTPAKDGLMEAYCLTVEQFQRGGMLYLCGNGGSFADAVHIKGELAKSFMLKRPITNAQALEKLRQVDFGEEMIEQLERGLPVVVLGESSSLRSAFANDKHPDFVYAQELHSFVEHIPRGVFMGISTSGNARNVRAAMGVAQAYGIATIAFTGPKGGAMAEQADVAWRVPGVDTPSIQENQLPLYHAYCRMIEAYFYGER